MSDRPPPIEGWGELIAGMDEALNELGVAGDEARAALVEGLHDALAEALGGAGGGGDAPEAQGAPDVRVLEGGLGEGEASATLHAVPELKVAGVAPAPDDEPRRERVVKVVKLKRSERPSGKTEREGHRERSQSRAGGLRRAGAIALHPEGQPAWQTVFRGPEPRGYRVSCLVGALEVYADGEAVERLQPGQTVDLEAALIRVVSLEPCRGVYVRLR